MSGYSVKSRLRQRKKTRQLKRRKRMAVIVFIAIAFIAVVVGLDLGVKTGKETKYPDTYSQYITKYAFKNNLDPYLVKALIKQESNFVADARSPVGAGGLMQLMESTAYEYGKKLGMENFNYMDPETNIKIGCYLLGTLIEKYGSVDTALAAYNAGIGNVDEWLANPQYSSDGKTLNRIPYEETRIYIEKINEYKAGYKKQGIKELINN